MYGSEGAGGQQWPPATRPQAEVEVLLSCNGLAFI
jgi:hypothetical protein